MFYGEDDGNKLVDERNYPDSIKKYLQYERQVVLEKLKQHDLLIEVGCMEARNMECAINNNKKYIGIDIVEKYINIANELVKKHSLTDQCEFICMNAENLNDIINNSKLINVCVSPLFYFPFNSFGNMENYSKVLDSISKIKNADFLLFSYDTDEKSTYERFKYYNNCNYDNLHMEKDNCGTRFLANNGLNSIAYNKEFLSKEIKCRHMNLETKRFADIGIVYDVNTREREKNIEL